MIATVGLVDIHPPHILIIFFLVMRTFKISSLNNFQIYIRGLLTIVTMMYIIPPGLMLQLEVSTLWPLHPLCLHATLCLGQTPICSLYLYEFSFCTILHKSEVIRYLHFTLWLIALSIMPSWSIYITVNGRIFFYFISFLYCIYTTFSLSIYPLMDA